MVVFSHVRPAGMSAFTVAADSTAVPFVPSSMARRRRNERGGELELTAANRS